MREMKWHLFDKNWNPLCWDNENWESERAIEFDTMEEAVEFWGKIQQHYPEIGRELSHVKDTLLYYDGGYVSGAEATKLMEEELNNEN